jgi:transcription initiation factor TFIIE subunit alpha
MFETDDLLVREYFRKKMGEDGLKMMANVPDREITESEIAELNDIKLTSVRKVLYKLYESRMAEYRTERNDDSGWITYLWSFNRDNVKKMMDKESDDDLNILRKKLEYERNGEFYQCHCQCVLFEAAAEQDFWCEDCESKFEYFDNKGLIKELEEQIEERAGENEKEGLRATEREQSKESKPKAHPKRK